MQTQAQIYRSARHQHPALPALSAWQHAGQKLEVDRWIARVGFAWNDAIAPRYARWREAGFDIEACLETDEHGWDLVGVDTIGEFQNRWVPGAIAHDRFNHRVLDWFVPANASYAQAHPVYGQAQYKRACAYGHDWDYLVLTVKAIRADVELGVAVLGGIESDSDEDFVTESVFDLTAEAIQTAGLKLRELCGEC